MDMLKWPKTQTIPCAPVSPCLGTLAAGKAVPGSGSGIFRTSAEQKTVEKYHSFSPQWNKSEMRATHLLSDPALAFLPSPLPHCAAWIPK